MKGVNMIKKVERWQAEDGTLFETLEDCEYYEAKSERIFTIFEEVWPEPTPHNIYDFIVKHTRGWK